MPASSSLRRTESGAGDEELPPSLKFLFDNFAERVVFVTKELCLAEESLSTIPRVLRNFSMLQRLDLSRNLFRSLPVKLINEYLPQLRTLDVSYNRLDNMRNVQQLGVLDELRELNLLGNPLVAINQRADLLAHLLFGNQRPRRERLEAMLQYQTGKGGRAANGQQASSAGGPAAESKPKIIASESTSRMIISGLSVGGVLPTHAVKVLNSAVSASAREYGTVVYADLTAAPVPRGSPFPMLTFLNDKTVTKEDIDQAAHCCSQPSGDTYSVQTLMAEPTRTRLPVREAKKKARLKGKAKMQELERQLAGIERERRQRMVDKALRRLMRHGTLEASAGSGGGRQKREGHAEESEEDSSDEEFVEGGGRRLDRDREEDAKEEEEIVLNAVGECGRRALSVSASLWQHVQGEDSVASFASSHSSPRLGGAEGGGGERPHHRGSRQPQPQLVHAAAEHSSSQRSCGGDARSGVSDAAGGSASVCSPAAAAKSSTARPRNNKAWVTCPPAWWANDSETAGEDAQQQAATLPTRQTVVEMGEEELQLSRSAVEAVAAVTRSDTTTDASKDKAQRALPAPTAEELVMRADSRVGWALVEDELRERDERVHKQQQAERPQQWRAKGGGRFPGAPFRRGKAPGEVSVTIGETLQLELPARRDYTSTLLHRRLPLHFKRLKLGKFLVEGKEEEESLSKSAEAVGRELDAVFTATNIQNKLEASATGGLGKTSLAWEQRKMEQQAAQTDWEERLVSHQARLRKLKAGRWPGEDEDDSRERVARKDAAGIGAAEAAAGPESVASCPVARELTKELNKLDKALNPDALNAVGGAGDSSHVELSAPARAAREAGKGVFSGAPRPSQAWHFEAANEAEQSKAAIKCELDSILLAGPENKAGSHDRRSASDAEAVVPDAASMLRKHAMLQVRHELGELQDTLARNQRLLLEQRRDIGASMDKMIISRRFGMAGGRKTLVGGLEFDG